MAEDTETRQRERDGRDSEISHGRLPDPAVQQGILEPDPGAPKCALQPSQENGKPRALVLSGCALPATEHVVVGRPTRRVRKPKQDRGRHGEGLCRQNEHGLGRNA